MKVKSYSNDIDNNYLTFIQSLCNNIIFIPSQLQFPQKWKNIQQGLLQKTPNSTSSNNII